MARVPSDGMVGKLQLLCLWYEGTSGPVGEVLNAETDTPRPLQNPEAALEPGIEPGFELGQRLSCMSPS